MDSVRAPVCRPFFICSGPFNRLLVGHDGKEVFRRDHWRLAEVLNEWRSCCCGRRLLERVQPPNQSVSVCKFDAKSDYFRRAELLKSPNRLPPRRHRRATPRATRPRRNSPPSASPAATRAQYSRATTRPRQSAGDAASAAAIMPMLTSKADEVLDLPRFAAAPAGRVPPCTLQFAAERIRGEFLAA